MELYVLWRGDEPLNRPGSASLLARALSFLIWMMKRRSRVGFKPRKDESLPDGRSA